MRITRIEVTMAEVVNLGDYNNTRPSITLEAALAEGDNWHEALDGLIGLARGRLNEQIDQALIRADQAPRYTTEPLYNAFVNNRWRLIVVAPSAPKVRTDSNRIVDWQRQRLHNAPLDVALQAAKTALEKYSTEPAAPPLARGPAGMKWGIIDCDDADDFAQLVADREALMTAWEEEDRLHREEEERKRREFYAQAAEQSADAHDDGF